MFLYSDSFSSSEQLSCFYVQASNWDVWVGGKLVDQRCRTERRETDGKRKESDKQSLGETLLSCQAVPCPRSVTHLPPGAHRSCQPALLPLCLPHTQTHVLLQRQVSSSHMPALFEKVHSKARWSWTERNQEKKKCSSSCVDISVAGVTAGLPGRHLGSAIVTSTDTESLQRSEINTSWPAACLLTLCGYSGLI